MSIFNSFTFSFSISTFSVCAVYNPLGFNTRILQFSSFLTLSIYPGYMIGLLKS